jgi:2-dehydro-3-deoxyglucarate aldolase
MCYDIIMDKKFKVGYIRTLLSIGRVSLGGWMQIPSPEIAEIMGKVKFDWVAVDMEHGSIGIDQLPNIFRAMELNDMLPVARIANESQAVRAMEAGAAGIIVPNIESAEDVEKIYSSIQYPPRGKRGVGYNRGNCYGVNFNNDLDDDPLLVGMIETQDGVNHIDEILDTGKLDAVLIGPYDLSASFKMTGQFDSPFIKGVVKQIKESCNRKNVAVGIHVIQPDMSKLKEVVEEGYTFIPYATDGTLLSHGLDNISNNDETFL